MRYISERESFECYMERFLKIFHREEKFVIFGSAFKAALVRKRIPDILFYVDNDMTKVGKEIDGVIIKSPDVLKEIRDIKIIVAVNEYMDIFEQLKNYGIPEENYCYFKEILTFRAYQDRKSIFLSEIGFIVTNRCTLSCKGCIEYTSYMQKENQRDFIFEEILDSINNFFRYVDSCEVVHIMGGETFLYKKLTELMQFLYEKYVTVGRVGEITITTNATLIPKEEVLKGLKKYNVLVHISDYRETIQNRSKVEELIEVFERRGIRYQLRENYGRQDKQKWFDLGNPFESHNMSQTELKQYYEKCIIDSCMTVWHSKMYNCSCVQASIMNLEKAETANDYCDLQTDSKVKFIKYYLGYNDNGYFDFCNYCNGFGKYLNQTAILPGEQ